MKYKGSIPEWLIRDMLKSLDEADRTPESRPGQTARIIPFPRRSDKNDTLKDDSEQP